MQNLLEPQLIDLVNDDEEHLIMFGSVREGFLELEELVDLEIPGVGQWFGAGA
jgi:hypothetical protein